MSRGKLLGITLDKLKEQKKNATTVCDVNVSKTVELIYIQTGEMKEHYKKYPEICHAPFCLVLLSFIF